MKFLLLTQLIPPASPGQVVLGLYLLGALVGLISILVSTHGIPFELNKHSKEIED